MSFLEDFTWRGLVYEKSEGIEEVFAAGPVTGYVGFDPSAASLHVGSLLPIMALARLQRWGHTPLAIVGGGTGMIGDPSGKSKERNLLSAEQVEENLEGIRAQLSRFLDFEAKGHPAQIINNAEWLTTVKAIELLRDVGKHLTVNYMLAKESVRRRLGQEEGLSFTEFSYMLLQAYDFLVLYDRCGCLLQMGGSDQWGNITAGIELIRRLRGGRAHGLVFPLITNAAGTKFGKTEEGTVWLDPRLTSPYRFYQFWLNTDDRDVGRYLRFFTWLGREEIEVLEERSREAPEKREAQKALAAEVTHAVHGGDAVERAQRSSEVLFGSELGELSADELLEIFSDVPSREVPREELAGGSVVDLLALAGLAGSKGEARRLIRGGGIYVNNVRLTDERGTLSGDDLIDGRVVVLRKGSKHYHLLRVTAGG